MEKCKFNKFSKNSKATTLNMMSVHMALPWVIMGSKSTLASPSQQSSSTHLRLGFFYKNVPFFYKNVCNNFLFLQNVDLQPASSVCLYISTEDLPPNWRPVRYVVDNFKNLATMATVFFSWQLWHTWEVGVVGRVAVVVAKRLVHILKISFSRISSFWYV